MHVLTHDTELGFYSHLIGTCATVTDRRLLKTGCLVFGRISLQLVGF